MVCRDGSLRRNEKWESEAAPERNLNLGQIEPERSREKKPWLAKYL
jgi:hypothetical protein